MKQENGISFFRGIDLVTIMRGGIGESVDEESFFPEKVEDEYRLNGGLYLQVGKGFHPEPFVPIEDFPEEADLGAEDYEEYWERLLKEDAADPDDFMVEVMKLLSARFKRGSEFSKKALLVEGKLVEYPELVALVDSFEAASLAQVCGLAPIIILDGVAVML